MINMVVVKGMVSGAHKYWLLSGYRGYTDPHTGKLVTPKDPRAINYGFYTRDASIRERKGGLGGYYLYNQDPTPACYTLPKVWFVQQTLGGSHHAAHWDYSQLCQFMKDLRVGDRDVPIATALTDSNEPGHRAIWDEPNLIDKDILPWK
jgi:hypothetical protein